VPETDPLFTGMSYRERGEPLTDPGFRYSLRMAKVNKIDLTGYWAVGERWGLIISPYDVFVPLLGSAVWGCKGYTSETARRSLLTCISIRWNMPKKAWRLPKNEADCDSK